MIKFNNIHEPVSVKLENIEYGDMFTMEDEDGFEHIYLKLERTTLQRKTVVI